MCWVDDPSQDSSGNWRFGSFGSPKNILVVTVAGQGDNPRYMLNIKYIYIYTLDPANSIEKVHMWVPWRICVMIIYTHFLGKFDHSVTWSLTSLGGNQICMSWYCLSYLCQLDTWIQTDENWAPYMVLHFSVQFYSFLGTHTNPFPKKNCQNAPEI